MGSPDVYGHPAIAESSALSARDPDEARPYEHKYAAGDVLKAAIQACSVSVDNGGVDAAVLTARRGLVLLDTDLLADGQACVQAALRVLAPLEESHAALLIECYNALGALQSGRDDLEGAQAHLECAMAVHARLHAMHARHAGATSGGDDSGKPSAIGADTQQGGIDQAVSPSSPTTTGTAAASVDARGAAAAAPKVWDAVERQHTSSLFYMAQLHAHAGRKQQSAEMCGATLQRQLDSGEYQLTEWVQNLLQLSGYYVSERGYAIAEHCMKAAEEVASRAASSLAPNGRDHLGVPPAPHPQLADCQHVVQGGPAGTPPPPPVPVQGSAGVQAGDAPDGCRSMGAAADGVGAVGVDAAQGSDDSRSCDVGDALEPDVAANLQLAWAKLYLSRLVASYEQHVDGFAPPANGAFDEPGSFPQALEFQSLALGDPREEGQWGSAAVASSFEGARDLFNAAMTRFKRALDFYELDGWVTEHVNIIMEISNAYRCLAGFEPDVKRKRLMHAQRVARLSPLHGQLNHEHFLGLVRSIALELGNASREVMELEEQEGRPASKVAAARRDAVRFYTDFLDSFRDPYGPGGKMPDRITDEANERYYLLASFSLGRLMSGGMVADRDLPGMAAAVAHLHATADYVTRHGVEPFNREASMAREMANLISEKLDLSQHLAAMKT